MKTDLTRRGFFRLVAGAASLVLVPPPPIALPIIYSDGVNCDADGMEALFRGEPVEFRNADDAARIGWRGDNVLSFGNVETYSWRTVKISGISDAIIRDMNILFLGRESCLELIGSANVTICENTLTNGGICYNSHWGEA